MQFNKYIWKLYKTSNKGREFIKANKPSSNFDDSEYYFYEYDEKSLISLKEKGFNDYIINDKVNLQKVFYDYFLSKGEINIEQIDEIYASWLEEGITFNGFEFIGKGEYLDWTHHLGIISHALYTILPGFFFPYDYWCDFITFQKICREYEIVLPEIPKRKDKKERALYYIKICKTLNEFRFLNNLSLEELIVFFYCFAPNIIELYDEITDELPNPSKVWYVGGGSHNHNFLDNAKKDDVHFWQCNIDTKPGDIIIMYCWTPRSYIHSVWRAITNGFYDPFFYYNKVAYISEPIIVPPITYKEIINNPILFQNPLAHSKFQGVNGYPISYAEYEEMLRIWEEKGMDTSVLPRIERIAGIPEDLTIEDERDVEINLVEPLLKRLEYSETDWLRQMPIKMGRGIRYYPDYSFGAISKRGEEKAKMVLETKYSIRNDKDLIEAYYQAKSYAIRLQTKCFILAAIEGIWIYLPSKNDYEYNKNIFYSWNELSNPDIFHKVLMMIGKKIILK